MSRQTLVFIKTKSEILLSKKLRGFGWGKWNGYGGKLNIEEDVVNGALRELEEESGLKLQPKDLKYLGYNEYNTKDGTRVVFMFVADDTGEQPHETEEMGDPQWFEVTQIPYHEMWPDSVHWLHLVIREAYFKGRFQYDGDCEMITNFEVQIFEAPPQM